ncbi:MAG TPA: YfhO family protein, partial [Chloroflexia bacterium]|nr:YfhO family protein [Chloroflexia bacterium]
VVRHFDVDPRHTVVLERGAATRSNLPGSAESTGQGTRSPESVKALSYAADVVELTARLDAPGWVILTDAYHPGWQATVDNNPATIEPAYYAYRAVKVDAGTHTIRMTFNPPTWQTGRIVTLLSLVATTLALLTLLALSRRTRRRAPLTSHNS